jgi:hypothetical protein
MRVTEVDGLAHAGGRPRAPAFASVAIGSAGCQGAAAIPAWAERSRDGPAWEGGLGAAPGECRVRPLTLETLQEGRD